MAKRCSIRRTEGIGRPACLPSYFYRVCFLAWTLLIILRWYFSSKIGFLYWGILLQVNKWFYKWAMAYPKISSSLPAKILGYIASTTILNYIGMFLTILNWEDAISFHSGVHYWGTYLLLGLLAITFVVPAPKIRKK